MNDGKILVTVICTTYNQGKYIRDALNGFVNQKTSFMYEVLIHDDASTDNTVEIIKEYEKKYPQIIKPIYQQENKYSKGVDIIDDILLPRARGKYIATCEGDDFWCDNNKLQKQVDFLEKNPDYIACVHNTERYHAKSGKRKRLYGSISRDLLLEDVVLDGGQSFHTSSIMYSLKKNMIKPEFTHAIQKVGDYPTAIYLALNGKIRYIEDTMSVYRYCARNSFTEMEMKNKSNVAKMYSDSINMLIQANEYSNYQYDSIFQNAIARKKFDFCVVTENYEKLVEPQFAKIMKEKKRYHIYKYRILLRLPRLKWIFIMCEKLKHVVDIYIN